ncbi:glycosyl transferase family 2 [Pseudomonas duriflava]|uniref:Glycosyl transferase family 2 n=1 Tax=Pseudomonas duriflava TaxID=459528 RepID=A0A562Q937_9PSED|nr:glycosyl transferase family 2 [Pseudomonas duriflava]
MHLRTEQDVMRHWDPEQRTPLVSIVCLTYNHAPYIAEAEEGFLMQETLFRFEILVNDDASDDGTQDVIRSYAERYPTLIKPIFRKENQYSQGVPYGIQLFALARGDYIAYCEGDDYWTDPLKLQIQVDFLEQNPDYVITYHDSYVFNSSGIVEQHRFQGQDHRDLSALELKQAHPLSTLTVCFRNKIQELPPELYTAKLMDICWRSLLGAYGKGKYLAEIKPAAYRIHEGGIFSMRT